MFKHILLIKILFLCASVSAQQAFQVKEIILGTSNGEATPLYQKAERVLTAAFAELGYRLKIESLPNKRSLLWADNGKVDGDLFRVSDLDIKLFPSLVRVNEPLFVIDQSVIGKAGVQVDGWESMKSYILAYERGTKFIDANRDKFANIILVGNFEQALSLINSGRADITITSRETATRYLSLIGSKYTGFKIYRPPLTEIALHVYLNKERHPHLADKLSLVLQKMKIDGCFQALSETTKVVDKHNHLK